MRQIVCVDSQLFFFYFWHRNILIASDGNLMFYRHRQNCFFVLNLCLLGLFVLDLILPVKSPSWRCNDAFIVFFGLMIVLIPVSL